jgi:hypothetical protein
VTAPVPTLTIFDWSAIPVVDVPVGHFLIQLEAITPETLALPEVDEPVQGVCDYPGEPRVRPLEGRHRVLRALLRGDATVPTRLLVLL